VRRVLFYVFYPSTFNVMFRAARLLADTGRYQPILFFDLQAPSPAQLAACRDAGFRCLSPSGEEVQAAADDAGAPGTRRQDRIAQALATFRQALPGVARELLELPFEVLRAGRQLAHLRKRIQLEQALLEREQIACVVLPGESVGYGTPMMVEAARRLGARCVVIPYAFATPADLAVDLGRDWLFGAERWANRLLVRRHPRWAYVHQGKPLVRLPASQAFPMEWLGLAPPQPWVLHSGHADSVLVENEYTRDLYLRTGIPAERLLETGSLSDDLAGRALADAPALRERVTAEAGLPPGRPTIVFSIYDWDYLIARYRPKDFPNTEALNRFWLESLRALEGWNVIVSPHPFVREEQLRDVESPSVRISRRPIEELIAICDLYVVCASATTRTAVACGKPVIDHDVFAFRYGHWSEAAGVVVVESKSDFAAALRRATSDPAYLASLAEEQRKLAPRFGRMDGRAGQRTLGAIDALMGGP
jgi:hypothetical protein